MNKYLLTSLAAVMAPLGMYTTSNQLLGSYQRSYISTNDSRDSLSGGSSSTHFQSVHSQSVHSHSPHSQSTHPHSPNHFPLQTQSKPEQSELDEDDILTLQAGRPAVELVIIDEAVPDKEMFYAEAKPGVDIREISADMDGLEQLKLVLSEYHSLDALHILSHAEDGVLFLGNSSITEASLQKEINTLSSIDNALNDGADLLFYGCNLAKGNNGERLLQLIAGDANVDVAASDDLTGSEALGGDWELEIQQGDVSTAPLFDSVSMQHFGHVLGYSGTLAFGNMPTGYAAVKSYTIPTTSYVFQITTSNNQSKDLYNYSAGYVYVSTNDATHNKAYVGFQGGETFDVTSVYVYHGFGAPTKTIRFTSSKGGTQDSTTTVAASSGTTVNFSGTDWQGISQFTISYSDETDMHWVKMDNLVLANVQASGPTITSATYNHANGQLVVTGTNFTATGGGANDIDAQKLTIAGEGGSYPLTSDTSDVEITSATEFTVTLGSTDQLNVRALLNKDGTAADDTTTYNLAGAAGFVAASASTADLTGNGITVSGYANPTITSSTYDYLRGLLVITGTGFSAVSGSNNDIVSNTFTFTGEAGNPYTLNDTPNVDVSSLTTATLTLSSTDRLNVNGLLNKDGFNADSGQAYNLAIADNWMAGGATSVNIADAAATINVSGFVLPLVSSATYNQGTGVLAVTGTNFAAAFGASDVVVSNLTLTGEGSGTYTLTTSNVEATNLTSFSVTLNATDKINVNGLLNKDGTQADDNTVYNLAAAEDWLAAIPTSANIADLSGNAVTVSNTQVPTITSATYNGTTGVLAVTGTAFAKKVGATNDIDVTKLSLLGQGNNSYTLTGTGVEITSETQFSVTLGATDIINVNGLLNKDGTTSADTTTYNLAAAEDWQAGAATNANVADLTSNGVTVSGTVSPTITSATYDFVSGVLAVTGNRFVKRPGGTNDVDLTQLTITGLANGTRTLTTTNVEITDASSFSVTLNSADKTQANALLDNNGTQASDSVTYNLAAADNWMVNADSTANIADATNGITVSNVPTPTVTSATYNFATGVLSVTGTDFEAKSGAANDVSVSKITLTGEGSGTYTLTTSDVEITNSTSFSVTLNATDKINANGLLNKNGTQADDNTVYNIAVADDFMANVTAGNTADTTGNPVTVSSVAVPAVSSATYDFSTGALVVTGTNFSTINGANNDVDPTKLTLTGDSGGTYTLTSSAVDISSETAFTITLNAADKLLVNGLLNKDGTTADSGTTYNLAAADNWLAGAAAATDIADLTSNSVTVSNFTAPAVTSATYNAGTAVLTVTGTNFTAVSGANNDVAVNTLTLLGEGSNIHTLTTSNVDVTNDTTFTVTLDAIDKINVNGLLNKDGTQSDDSTTYNLSVADNYMLAGPASVNIADVTNAVTVSNVQVPAISSATYNATTGVLAVTGTSFAKRAGVTNDIDVTKLSLVGEGGNSYTLTGSGIEITSETLFSVTLTATDIINVNGLLNKDGLSSADSTTYNLAAAEDWQAGAAASANVADLTGNGVTVSGTVLPTITSATYDFATGVLAVTGSRLVKRPGTTNDVDLTQLTITGLGNGTRTLTTTNVEITDATSFSVTLNSGDKTQVNTLLDNNGTQATDSVTYNLAAADNWMPGADSTANTADATNGITVSNVPVPTVTSATYNFATGVLSVTGTDFEAKSGAANDVSVSKITLTGEGSGSYTLTGSDVEITNSTSFSVTLSATDKINVNALLNKNGTQADDNTVYNIAVADDFIANVTAGNTADTTGNPITVSSVAAPMVTSATYDFSTGALVVTGTNLSTISGANNDVDPTKLTLTGDSGGTYTLTSSAVDITSETAFSITLNAVDQLLVNGLLNKDGLTSDSGTTYNIAAADNWLAGAAATTDIADTVSNGITVSNFTASAITSAAYNAGTGVLTVTGTNFTAVSGANNDVAVNTITLLGEGSNTYTLTTSNVDVTNDTTFTVTLDATDKININGLLNKNGTQADDSTTYNLAAADNYMLAGPNSVNIADATNTVTVSNVQIPAVTSATYDASTGALVVTGTAFVRKAGATNDIDVTKLTLLGEGSNTHTLTGSGVEITSETQFSVTLSAIEIIIVNGLLNKNGTSSGGGTTYNLSAAEDWLAGAASSVNIIDATNAITVSNSASPAITSATYDFATGVLAVTGTRFVKAPGATNDVDLTKLTLTGLGNGTRVLTTTNVEITDATSFSATLNSADKTQVNLLLNANGTQASDSVTYNLAAADNWMPGADSTVDIADATNGITVSNAINPEITSATYDFATGLLTVTGSDFEAQAGAANDVTVNKITLTGQGGSSYTLTSATNVEITNSTTFSVTLSGIDKTTVNGLLNKDGTTSDDGTTYNIAVADDFIANVTAGDTSDTTGNAITVSSVAAPAITSASYDFATGALVVTGTNFTTTNGANNDLDPGKLTFTGDAGGTYTLTSGGVDITSETEFTITLNSDDQLNIGGLLNKNGTSSGDGTTYNIAAADNWMVAAASSLDIADLTSNGVNVSNVAVPTVTSATWDFATGILVVTGTDLVKELGASNDVDISKLTLTGDAGGTYTLTSSSVELTSGTQFSVTLNTADQLNVGGLLNKNGTASGDSTTYNIAAADNWLAGADATVDIADLTSNGVTVSNVAAPSITSATYDATTGVLAVTGTSFVKELGANNDVSIANLTLTGEASGTRTLTSSNVEITSKTAFSVTLNASDKLVVNGLLNKNGTVSADSTTYNLAATTLWLAGADATVDTSDTTNAITVSNVVVPAIASATYDISSGTLAVTASGLVSKAGATNDIDITKLTVTGEGSGTYTLTSSNVEVSSETAFSVTLNTADQLAVAGLLNKNGTSSGDGTAYNLAAADDWLTGADASVNIADLTGNSITVSNVAAPTITSATYDASTGVLAVTGTDFVAKSGVTNDVSVSKLTISGDGGGSYTLTTSDVEVTNATSFSVTLNTIDRNNVGGLLNKNGTSSDDGTTYNLAAADDWMSNADSASDIADTSGNGITVSNVATPTVTSATYDATTSQLVITGTNLVGEVGATNDLDPTKLTITGDGNNTYTLTTSAVEITDHTQATITLNATDQLVVNGLLNKNGTSSDDATVYNLAAADNWLAGAGASVDIADLTSNSITVSNVTVPTVTSATYNYTTGAMTVTGTNFRRSFGATNDVDVTKLSLTGEGSNTYTLTGSSVEVSSATSFSLTLSETDRINVNGLLNKDGTTADDSTTYNLAAADNWMPSALMVTDIADTTAGVTVSNVVAPAITSMAYDYATGILTVTGTHFVKKFGNANDIDVSMFTFTGENGGTYTLTSTADVEISSSTSFSITLTGADLTTMSGLVTENGTTSGWGNTYNFALADNWMTGVAGTTDITSAVNGVTASNVPDPTITSATYDASTGVLTVTGTDFQSVAGSNNDVDVSKLTITGQASATYTLTTSNVDISSATAFSVTLNSTDRFNLNAILNRNGTSSDDSTIYNLAAADDYMLNQTSGNIADTTSPLTVSGVTSPTITSATYNASTGVLQVTGANLVNNAGASNDVDISTLTITGEAGDTYTIVSTSDVELTSETQFSITLSGSDLLAVNGLLNKNGTSSDDATTYNLAAADNWATGALASEDIADTPNAITVSGVTTPTVSSATYNATTGVMVITGTAFAAKSGANNDLDVSKLTITGNASATYTLTTSSVEVSAVNQATVTLNATDQININGLLNNNGATSEDGTAYNIAAADNWMIAAAASVNIADLISNPINVSNVNTPSVTSATYNYASALLTVTGTNFRKLSGANNDVDVSKLSLTGEGNNSYTLTTNGVEITSMTEFSVTLNDTDKINVNGLLNKAGIQADDNTTYNLAAADNWMPSVLTVTDIADVSGNGVTVGSLIAPAITSMTYDYATGVVTVTGTNFVKKFGSNNDVDISLFTFTGENGATYTLTSTSDVEITSSTSFSFTLTGTDLTNINGLVTENGATSGWGNTYNFAAADNWMTGVATSTNIADATNGFVASNVPDPSITSATYDASTGVLVATGTDFQSVAGSANDVDVSKLTITGEAGATYTLTTSNVDITSATEFSVTLNTIDKLNVNGLLDSDGISSTDSTTYNLAAADNFMINQPSGNTADLIAGITVSNVAAPTITSASYNALTGTLTVNGTRFVKHPGANNDIDLTKLTITGGGGSTFTLTTTPGVEVSSETQFVAVLSASDRLSVNGLLNADGTSSDPIAVTVTQARGAAGSGPKKAQQVKANAVTYNIAFADDWMAGASTALDISDNSGNGITVSNVVAPTITSATYNATTGVLTVTGSNLTKQVGSNNDIDISAFSLTGEDGVQHTITSANDVEVTSETSFSVTLDTADRLVIDGLLNKNGVTSDSSQTTFNMLAADNWLLAAGASSDLSDNLISVTVTDVQTPTITSATYDASTGVLTLTGTYFRSSTGAANDVLVSSLTLTGHGNNTHVLTSDHVDVTSATTLSFTVNDADKVQLAALFSNSGTSALDGTTYNIAAADNWMAGAAASTDIADHTSGVTVSNLAAVTVSLSASATSIAETSGNSVLTATLTRRIANNVVVSLAYSGTATNVGDYTRPDSITITAGQLTGTATVSAVSDVAVEQTETVIVDIDGVTAGTDTVTENGTQQQTISITDDDIALVTLSVGSTSISETNGSTTVTATLDKPTFENVTVNLAYSGTATSGTDYATPANSITITAGQTSGTATLNASSDTDVEADETVTIDITSVTGGKVSESGVQQQTVTITDDDTAAVTLSVSSANMVETGGASNVIASLDKATFENVTVSFAYSGTASSGTDYNTPASSVTIVAGQTSASTSLSATADDNVEGNETIVVDITGVTGGKASESGTQQQTISIFDDDAADASVIESNAVLEPVAIPSTANSSGSAVAIFDFTIIDGGSTDNKPLNVSQIVINVSGTADASKLVYLLNGNDASNVTGTYSASANTITFSGLSISVAHGTNEVYNVSAYYSDNTSLTDGQTLILSTDGDTDFTIDAANTQMGTTNPVTNGTGSTVDVTASQLVFTTQPAGSVSGIALTTQPVVQARDAAGNIDTDFTEVVTLTENAAGDVTGNTVTAVAGTATFSSLNYTATEDNETLVFSANDDAGTGSDLASVDATAIVSQVIATRLVFATQPAPLAFSSGVATAFTTVLVIQAVDANGTLDSDYNANVTLSEVNGAGTALLTATSDSDADTATVTLAMADGAIAVEGLTATYTASGAGNETFNLQAASGSLSSVQSDTISINDVPTIVGAPTSLTVIEDVTSELNIASVTLGDTDGDTVTLTLAVTRGLLTSTDGNGIIAGVTVSNSGSSSMTLAGSIADLNTYLDDVTKLRYTSASNDDTNDNLALTLNDGTIDSAVSSVAIAITPVDDAPIITSGNTLTVVEDSVAQTLTVTASDVDSTDLTWAVDTQGSLGSASISGSGIEATFSYTPTGNANGTDTVVISLTDGTTTVTQTINITISAVNDAPVITGGTSLVFEEDGGTQNLTLTAVDADNSNFIWSITAPGSLGTATITGTTATGLFSYTPNENLNGTDSVVVTVSDGQLTAQQTISISISAVNDAPEIDQGASTTVIMSEDANPLAFNLTLTAIDFEESTINWTLASPASNGVASVEPGGVVNYAPDLNFNGSDSFVVNASDGELSDSITVNVTLQAVNDAPVISGTPETSVSAGNLYSFTPTASDVDNDSLSFSVSNLPAFLNINSATGNISGTPARADAGTYNNIVLSVFDGTETVSLAAFDLTVVDSNTAPVISQGESVSVTMSEDASPVAFALTLAATDNDGDSLSWSVDSTQGSATLGTASVDNNGVVSYVPVADANGQDSFNVSVTDGIDSDTISVLVTITPVNDAPVITGTPETTALVDTSYNFTPVATDTDSETLTFSVENLPAWATFDTENGALTGTPGVSDTGTSGEIVISVSDGELNATLTAFSISVIDPNANVAPTVIDVVAETDEDVVASITLLGEDANGDNLTYSIVNAPANGEVTIENNVATYTPGQDFNGEDSFGYFASDGALESDVATVSITINPVNDAPVISGEPATQVASGSAYLFEPIASDVDNENLVFTAENLPAWASINGVTGSITGSPGTTDIGVYDNIIVTVSDGELSTSLPAFSINVIDANANTAPVAQDVSVSTEEDTTVTITLQASDADGDNLTYTVQQQPAFGTVTLTGDQLLYTPDVNVGDIQDSLTYSASDGVETSNTAVVTIRIVAVNDPPVISGAADNSIRVGTEYRFAPVASDIENDTLTFTIANQPRWSNFDGNTGVLSGVPGSADAGTYGNVTISVSDGLSTATLAPFNIDVLQNNIPLITGSSDTRVEVGVAYSFTPNASDADGDTLTFSIVNQPAWSSFDAITGTLSGTPASNDVGISTGIEISVSDGFDRVPLPSFDLEVCEVCGNLAPTINGLPASTVVEGSVYSFVPVAQDANGDLLSFSITNQPVWTVFDSATGALTGTPGAADIGVTGNIVISVTDGALSASLPAFTITVSEFNDAPVISGTPDSSVFQDDEYLFTPTASDADGDTLTFSIENQPGWASFNPRTGTLRGTPTAANVGSVSNIIIRVSDGSLSTALAAFSINVLARNSAPTISGSPRTGITQGEAYRFTPVSSDVDGDTLSFSASGLPLWLSIDSATGVLSGTPQAEDVGTTGDIVISVTDGQNSTNLAAFTITVTSANTAPVASSSALSVAEDGVLVVSADVVDQDGDNLTFTVQQAPQNGSLEPVSGGWNYTPNANFTGTDSFVYLANDGESDSNVATVEITVDSVNDAPQAVDDVVTVQQSENGIYTLDVLANDTDVDITTASDSLTIQGAQADFGAVTVVDNQLQFSPGISFIGTVDLVYVISDSQNSNDQATVSLTVDGVAGIGSPIVNAPADVTVNATGLFTTVDLGQASAMDADGNPLPVTNLRGSTQFSPGLTQVFWQTEDSFGEIASESQNVAVNPIISLSKDQVVSEGSQVTVDVILNGDAPEYPMTVGYSVSGIAESGLDFTALNGSVTFTEGREQSVIFEVLTDEVVESNETIVFTLNSNQNVGANNQSTITISEQNIAPEIQLVVSQGSEQRLTVAQDEGNVRISATVTDANPNDDLSLEWSSNGLTNINNSNGNNSNGNNSNQQFVFNPSDFAPGVYQVTLFASDNGEPRLSTTADVFIEVVSTLIVLSATEDTDGDLIPDAQEGFGDDDGDGIANYLDAIDDCNVVPEQAATQDGFLVESEPGVCLRQGSISAVNSSEGLEVITDESINTGGRTGSTAKRQAFNSRGELVNLIANGLPEDTEATNVGGIFDFILYDLPEEGQVSTIVLPQRQPVPANAVYRKYNILLETWGDFVIDDNNQIYTAQAERGFCPPPGSDQWVSGLNEGHWCVQLRIEDGGLNDSDGEVNGAVVDPGGVAVVISNNQLPVALDDTQAVKWNTSTAIDVLRNDSDADGDALVISSVTGDFGRADIVDSQIIYTPNTDYIGADTLSYAISDGNGGTGSAQVFITITGNRAPGAVADSAQTDDQTAIEIDVLANDMDVDGDVLSLESATAETGMVSITDNNTLLYVPLAGFDGLDTITYVVADTSGATDTATVSVVVDGNQAPEATNDSASTEFDTAITVDVLNNDMDINGDVLTVTQATADSGNVQINADNTLTFTPATGFAGTVLIEYTISDGTLSASAILTITVAPEPEPPVEVVTVNNKSSGSIGVLAIMMMLMVAWRRRNIALALLNKRY